MNTIQIIDFILIEEVPLLSCIQNAEIYHGVVYFKEKLKENLYVSIISMYALSFRLLGTQKHGFVCNVNI